MNELLQQFLKSKTKNEITLKIFARATYYQDGSARVYIPKVPYEKLMPEMELNDSSASIFFEDEERDIESKTSNEDNLERSLRRTKRLIQDYVLNNSFELFCTFTFSPKKTDRQNVDLVKTKMGNWLKNQQMRYGKFDYLIVPEFHKDRKSLHFHALFSEYKGQLIDAHKRINGRKAYNFKSYTLGINSAIKMDNKRRVASYVRKYILKDMPQFHGKHRFWATRGLMAPRTEDNPSEWYLHEKPQREYVSEYGRTLYFTDVSSATPPDNFTDDSSDVGLLEEEA